MFISYAIGMDSIISIKLQPLNNYMLETFSKGAIGYANLVKIGIGKVLGMMKEEYMILHFIADCTECNKQALNC